MDGRAECRIERDPTMDNRIVHAVCVSNKKEQCQLRDRERNLQNEFIVEQHIIRREEKSLLKQFQKLQLEKHHRHGDEVHSPRPSYKRLLSPHDTHMARSRHSAHSSLMAKSPMASGHQLSSQRVNLQSAQPSYARMKHGHPASSSHFSSFASSGYSLQSSHDDGSLPNIDGKVRHGASHEYQKRKEEERRHLNRHQQHLNNEIGSLVESYLAPHQPAGYGHSIKDVSLHKEMHRYRLQKAKCKHRRHTVDFDYPGNYCHVGNLHLLNHIGPDSDHSSLHKPEFKQHQTDEAMKGTSHEKHQPANKKSTSSLNIAVHRPTAVAELHGNQHLGYQIPEKERCELDKKKDGKPENLEITIKISRKRPQPAKTATSKEKHIPASLPTDRTTGGIDTSSSVESKQSTGSTSYHSLHRSASKARPSAEIGGSRDIVPFVRFPNQKDGDVKQRSLVVSETARHNNKHRTEDVAKVREDAKHHPQPDFEIPADTLAELEAICGSSTQGYFNQKGFGNRRGRFKQLVKELLMKRMPAAARKRHLAEFDPLEALQCRYLRLSPSNIEDLMTACKEAGVEVDFLHPHSNVTDLSEYVFGHKSDQ